MFIFKKRKRERGSFKYCSCGRDFVGEVYGGWFRGGGSFRDFRCLCVVRVVTGVVVRRMEKFKVVLVDGSGFCCIWIRFSVGVWV